MQRINTATKSVDLFGAGKHGFKDGNKAQGIPATDLSAAIMNALQEEPASVVEASGQTLDPANNAQLLEAIRRLAGGHVTTVTNGTTALTAAHAGLVVIDATAGNVILNLPAANVLAALEYNFVRIDATTNTVTINRAGADTIDEAFTAFTLTGQGDARTTQSNGVDKWLSRSRARGNPLLKYSVAPGTLPDHAVRIEQITDPMTNVIIGGDFSVNPWQRGTSLTGITAGANYLADRFALEVVNSGTWKYERSTDVPAFSVLGRYCTSSVKLSCTAADATVDATDYVRFYTPIEGYNYISLYQRPKIVPIAVKTNKPGVYSLAVRNAASDRSYIGEITVNAADTWELKWITVPADPSSGTWNFTNGVGASLGISLVCGATYKTAPNAWANGNYLASNNQSNNLGDAVNNYFSIAEFRMYSGSTLLALPSRNVQQELALCHRYYERLGGVAASDIYIVAYMTAGSGIATPVGFNTKKRALPTMTKVGTWTVSNCGQPVINGVGVHGVSLTISATSTGQMSAATVDGTTYLIADAEL